MKNRKEFDVLLQDLTPMVPARPDPNGFDPNGFDPSLPMRWVAMAVMLSLPVICSCGEYPSNGKDGAVWIVPDDYRVDPNLYPKYRAIRDFQPPDLLPNPNKEPYLKMPKITTDYAWEVRHKVDDQLWLYSEEYARRAKGNIEIAITIDGRVLPGWRGISDPNRVLLRGDRAIPLSPGYRHDLDWGNEPLFEPIRLSN